MQCQVMGKKSYCNVKTLFLKSKDRSGRDFKGQDFVIIGSKTCYHNLTQKELFTKLLYPFFSVMSLHLLQLT